MTDIELQELKDKKDKLIESSRKFIAQSENLQFEAHEIDTLIKEEENNRRTRDKFDYYIQRAEEFLYCYSEHRKKKTSDEIWIIEINGKRYSSGKSKNTWTSENKAYNAICDYLLYHCDGIDYNVRIDNIVDKLIEKGIIVIKQAV